MITWKQLVFIVFLFQQCINVVLMNYVKQLNMQLIIIL